MPPVAGFLEMFAGVPYNREKNESLICTPPRHTLPPLQDLVLYFLYAYAYSINLLRMQPSLGAQ